MPRFLCLCLFSSLIVGCSSSRPLINESPPTEPASASVTVLGDDLSPVREAFNAASNQWRTVALVSPTCSECVLGAEAVAKEITARYPVDQVAALIVWIPMLPSDSEEAAVSASAIFPPHRAAHFYDSEQTMGTRYAQETFASFYPRARASLLDDHFLAPMFDDRALVSQPQWDLYMLYAPGVRWDQSSDAPPMPTRWIRHLGRMDGVTSTYWQNTPESGPREGDLFTAIRTMADSAFGDPTAPGAAER